MLLRPGEDSHPPVLGLSFLFHPREASHLLLQSLGGALLPLAESTAQAAAALTSPPWGSIPGPWAAASNSCEAPWGL